LRKKKFLLHLKYFRQSHYFFIKQLLFLPISVLQLDVFYKHIKFAAVSFIFLVNKHKQVLEYCANGSLLNYLHTHREKFEIDLREEYESGNPAYAANLVSDSKQKQKQQLKPRTHFNLLLAWSHQVSLYKYQLKIQSS